MATAIDRIEATVVDVFQPTKGEAWGVATVQLADGTTEKVVGSVGMAREGEILMATGAWVTSAKYGRQFRAQTVEFHAPRNRGAIAKFLAATVSGIGEHRAGLIVEHFGVDAMAILDARPDLLRGVKGIPKSQATKIIASYETARCTKNRDILLYLQTAGCGPKLAGRIVEKYGDEADAKIAEDPYRLMHEFSGVGFLTCDKIADQLRIPADDRRRVRAAFIYHLDEDCAGQGHTHLPTDGLVDRLGDKMRKTRDVESATIRKYLGELLAEGVIVFEDGRLYLASTHRVECAVAERLVEVARLRRSVDVDAANGAIERAEASDRVTLTDEQRQAVYEATAGGIFVTTGGPGTGKSLVTRAIVYAFDALGVRFALCAPTGKAAQRCSEATGREASTVHRLLGFRGDSWEYNRDNPLDLDAVIVDEVSMVDLSLMHALTQALPPRASLVLVGDVDQLPSVMPGSVLDDVISSGLATVVTLTTIHRQGKGSAISLAAAAVNAGKLPDGPDPRREPSAEFAIIPIEEGPAIADAVVRLVLQARDLWGFDPVWDVQVLTPMKKYAAGVVELNTRLQAALNPHEFLNQIVYRGVAFRVGDKVMQTKNDYERGVMNGEVGRIVETRPGDGELLVDFGGEKPVAYDREDLAHLVLAYACTVHKFQGSEAPVVIMPLDPSHWFMQFRALVYTGITRARKRCVLVGDVGKAQSRYRAKKRDERITWLASRMREIAGTRG